MRQGEGAQDEAAGSAGGEAVKLGADVGGSAGVQEAGVAELLDPGRSAIAGEIRALRIERKCPPSL
jgi:hypothetical protein